ncbi:MAG: TIGR01777 family oxidoreductase [Ferruginibacter sp.]
MKNKKIVIAGGTGFIGRELCNFFGDENEIVVIGRQLPYQATNAASENNIKKQILEKIRFVKWNGISLGDWATEIDGSDLVINLAGKSVNCRYTKKNRKEIFDSRTNTTKVIGLAIQQATHPPALWINAASATIYPHTTNTPRDESFTDFQNDFSVQVCRLWEKTFYEQRTPFTRKVALRMAITLGPGGVMIPYFNLLKFGLGGQQGNGEQMYSWVHIEDTCRMIGWLDEHPELEGTYNCSSPEPVTNKVFMQTLRKATRQVTGITAHTWMLKIGAAIIGTETELILKSRWVLPARILATGFQFKYALLENAVQDIIGKTPRKKYHLF